MPEYPFTGSFPHLCVTDLVAGDSVDSDTVDSGPYYGFYSQVAGTLKFNTLAGTTVALPVTANVFYNIGVARLWATGHTTIAVTDVWLAR